MNPKKSQVSLEDLLRVKHAERPRPEFWTEFERELRAKQLAAIVEPRPWWAPLIRVGARFSHFQLPVGAAAILALSFVTVREYRKVDAAPRIDGPAAVSAMSHPLATGMPVASTSSKLAVPKPADAQLAALESASRSDAPADTLAVATGQVAHTMPLAESAPAVAEPTPSARYIAANLAAVQAANPKLVDEVFGQSTRAAEAREPVRDPLAQIGTLGDSRRSRLLATALPAIAGSTDIAVGSSDRIARRLTEERLYDTISRVGVKGDRVAFKF
jgi:hypothetical protein